MQICKLFKIFCVFCCYFLFYIIFVPEHKTDGKNFVFVFTSLTKIAVVHLLDVFILSIKCVFL